MFLVFWMKILEAQMQNATGQSSHQTVQAFLWNMQLAVYKPHQSCRFNALDFTHSNGCCSNPKICYR
jgi:hypothetical protein